MPRFTLTLWRLAALVLCLGASVRAQAGEVTIGAHTFKLPDGFTIELVANSPLVERPIVAAFDEQGMLYVADSSGSNEKVDVQVVQQPHRIVRLEDSDGNGRFDKQIVFAPKMMFPEGVMWLEGALYVAAPPNIFKLQDKVVRISNGESNSEFKGVASTVWFAGKTLTGCANDLHGPYPGRDGWIYWCKGAFAQQTYERPGKQPFVTKASHIFRARRDGTGIEPVMTGGMDNPVDTVITPGGERIFTTTFFQHPGGGKRDGLIHAVYGGVYGKVHDVLTGHVRTRPDVMPVLTHLGAAAPCGLVCYESTAFGEAYCGNLFASLFNMQKVTRHALKPQGATFVTEDEDFVVSNNKDFHPTDVIEDADGSLLIVDTGGWYKLCCPTSQLSKPDVLGAIYRVRKLGAPAIADPRGKRIDFAKLSAAERAKLLGDARPAVRQQAIATFRQREGSEALSQMLVESKSALARREAVWASSQIDSPQARSATRMGLADRDPLVRQAAAHVTSVWRDRDAAPHLVRLVLKDNDLQVARAAAEALGRVGTSEHVASLLEALTDCDDTVLEHSLLYAAWEIGDAKPLAAQLIKLAGTNLRSDDDNRIARGLMMMVDQLPDGGLKPALLRPFLGEPDPAWQETLAWVLARHADWGDELVDYFEQRLAAAPRQTPPKELANQLASLAASSAGIQKLLAGRLADAKASPEELRVVLQAVGSAGLKKLPDGWASGVAKLLKVDNALKAEALSAARGMLSRAPAAPELVAALTALGLHEQAEPQLRLDALASISRGLESIDAPVWKFLVAELAPDRSAAERGVAAAVIGKAHVSPEQLIALTSVVESASPLEIARLLEPFEQSHEDAVGLALLAAVERRAGPSAVRVELLKPKLAKYSDAVRARAEKLYERLNLDNAQNIARLEEMLSSISGGDVRRGQAVFNGTKALCSACHAIGYLGGNIGPDLTRIGQVRTERDLLESIVFPSASFVRSYEPLAIVTSEGKVYNGVMRRENADEVVLAISAKEEVRIARSDIEETRPGTVSVMPAGLDQQLSRQELADLVAFLKNCK